MDHPDAYTDARPNEMMIIQDGVVSYRSLIFGEPTVVITFRTDHPFIVVPPKGTPIRTLILSYNSAGVRGDGTVEILHLEKENQ